MAKRVSSKPSEVPQSLIPTFDINTETTFLEGAKGAVLGIFKGAAAFFQDRAADERKSREILAQARTLKPATDAASDAENVKLAKLAKVHIQNVTDGWEGFTSLFNRLHKRGVELRKRGIDPATEAYNLANGLHNRWLQAEEQRVREENERRRREEEERARVLRQQELDLLEQQKLDAEESLEGLSDRERSFVSHYLLTGNALAAARTAGYQDPAKMAPRLLASTKVGGAIRDAVKAKELERQAEAVRQSPLDVDDVEDVKPDVEKVTGAGSRTTKSAVIVDLETLKRAIITGQIDYEMAREIVDINQAALNRYARSLGKNIERVLPGVRFDERRGVI